MQSHNTFTALDIEHLSQRFNEWLPSNQLILNIICLIIAPEDYVPLDQKPILITVTWFKFHESIKNALGELRKQTSQSDLLGCLGTHFE